VIVVADSSPLITLAQSQHFDLLHDFYVEVIISREVHYEVCVAGAALGGALEVQRATWIRVQPTPPVSSPEVQAVGAGLGLGERSIIYLALTLGADLVLIDDRRARSAAKTVGSKSPVRSPFSNGAHGSVELMTCGPYTSASWNRAYAMTAGC